MPFELTTPQTETVQYKVFMITDFHVDANNLIVHIMYDKGEVDSLGNFIPRKRGEVETFSGQDVQNLMVSATQYTIQYQDIYKGLKQAMYEAIANRTGLQGVVK